MKILFLHGLGSTPGGIKPTYLAEHGHEVVNPHLPDDDFTASVHIAQSAYDRSHPDVVVGSSRGGAVAMCIDSGDTPLVLLCPAWRSTATPAAVKPGTTVLHARGDAVVPFADSEELIRRSPLGGSVLIETGHEHRLVDPASLQAMLTACQRNRRG